MSVGLLTDAPLAMVLCQVRWPELGHLQGDITDQAKLFGAKLAEFPLYSQASDVTFTITSQGVERRDAGTIYQWSSVDRLWSVVLGRTFVSVLTRSYVGFEGFITRLREVLAQAKSALALPVATRIGFRYVNQIADPADLERLGSLVRTEILGYQALPVAGTDATLVQALSQASFQVGDGVLQARSGPLSPGQAPDPAVESVPGPSWVLDIDSFADLDGEFDVDALIRRAGHLSDVGYDFFKWVITPAFVARFGGEGE